MPFKCTIWCPRAVTNSITLIWWGGEYHYISIKKNRTTILAQFWDVCHFSMIYPMEYTYMICEPTHIHTVQAHMRSCTHACTHTHTLCVCSQMYFVGFYLRERREEHGSITKSWAQCFINIKHLYYYLKANWPKRKFILNSPTFHFSGSFKM